MIALLAPKSAAMKGLADDIRAAGHDVVCFNDASELSDLEDFGIVLVHEEFLGEFLNAFDGHDDADTLFVGIDVAEDARFDRVVASPVNWKALAKDIGLERASVFDPETKAEIEDLLGREIYVENLMELVKEIDHLEGAFATLDAPEQIASVHKASGVAAMLGVIGLHKKLLGVEVKGKAGDWEAMNALWQRFVASWPHDRQEIEQLCG